MLNAYMNQPNDNQSVYIKKSNNYIPIMKNEQRMKIKFILFINSIFISINYNNVIPLIIITLLIKRYNL